MHPLRAGRSGTSVSGIRRLQRALVIAEVALSIVPLIGGGLMIRSFWNLTHAPHRVRSVRSADSARVQMQLPRVSGSREALGAAPEPIDRVRELPGVEAVSAATSLPFAQVQHAPVRTRRRSVV